MKSPTFRQAFLDTLPVMTGYVFLGTGFGIIMTQNGYGPLWSIAMSAFIYAGSMQYVAVTMLGSGAGLATAALTTLMVNARHLFYGISMVDEYKHAGKEKPYLIFALTDETYSLVSRPTLPEGINKLRYCLLVSVLDQFYWVAGTALGALAGQLPIDFTGIDFALTALFITIFTEQWLSTTNHLPALTGMGAAIVCLALFGADVFLIPTMIAIALILIMTRRGERRGK